MTDPEKSEETIATPPKRGVPTDPDSGTVEHCPYPGPRGSLSSVFIPAGRLGAAAPEGGADGSRVRYPFPLVLHDSRSVLAVKGTLRRFAPWTATGSIWRDTLFTREKGGCRSASDFVSHLISFDSTALTGGQSGAFGPCLPGRKGTFRPYLPFKGSRGLPLARVFVKHKHILLVLQYNICMGIVTPIGLLCSGSFILR